MHTWSIVAVLLMLGTVAATPQTPETRPVTWTGWFSEERCAREPAAGELVRPNGTSCVKRCLDEGSTPVFLSEQTNAIFKVRGHAAVKDDVGHRVEVVADVDYEAKSISVRSVKRLSEVTAMCLLPKKKG
jgi:hypothetical protein